MMNQSSRRQFLKAGAATGIGFWVAGGVKAQESKSPNEKIAMASIGVAGKGSSDSNDAGRNGQMVAICDIDDVRLDAAQKNFPKAKRYNDFRLMLTEMGDKIDAVTVSTPDHCHAVASVMAMRMGIHCFTQKPLAHSVHEVRVMAQVAREKGVATQMGNQGTAMDGVRKAAALIQAGVIGDVSEVHVWTNRPIWPQGGERSAPKPHPNEIRWDLWIGPAPWRPYAANYHPFAWRGWWDFGTGALGDMACHTMNMPYMALDLKDPISLQAETPGHNGDSYPKWSVITYEFPANAKRGPVKMVWYDGGKRPGREVLGDKVAAKGYDRGCAFLGTKGKLLSPNDYGARFELVGDVKEPKVEFEKSPGHFTEWIEAIKGGKPARSNFPDYAAGLAETVLLGNLAVWVAREPGLGEKVLWDAKNARSTNVKGLEKILKPEFRQGYSL